MEESSKEIIEYLKIIWSKKWIIIVGTTLTVLATVLVSFLTTPVYEIYSIIHPANISTVDNEGKYLQFVVEDPIQIVGKVMHGTYNDELTAEFQIPAKELPELRAEEFRRTSLVRIWTRTTDIDFGKRLLWSLINQIKMDMDSKIDIEINAIDASVTVNRSKKKSVMNEIIRLEKELETIQKRKRNIQKEMVSVKNKIEGLKQEPLQTPNEISPKTQPSPKTLLPSAEIQQNLRYYELLNDEMNAVLLDEQNMISKINEGQAQISTVDDSLTILAERKGRLEYAKIIKEPTASFYPIRPKKKLNALAAFFLGLLVFTVIVFFVNYLEKNW